MPPFFFATSLSEQARHNVIGYNNSLSFVISPRNLLLSVTETIRWSLANALI